MDTEPGTDTDVAASVIDDVCRSSCCTGERNALLGDRCHVGAPDVVVDAERVEVEAESDVELLDAAEGCTTIGANSERILPFKFQQICNPCKKVKI